MRISLANGNKTTQKAALFTKVTESLENYLKLLTMIWARDNNPWPKYFCEKKIKPKDKNGKNVLLKEEYH